MPWFDRFRSRSKPEPSLDHSLPIGHQETPSEFADEVAMADRWYVPTGGDPRRFVPGADGLPPLHLIRYRDASGEVVLRLCEDSTGLLVGPTDRRLFVAGVYSYQLRGEAHHRRVCKVGDFSPGAPVLLVRQPDNPHDSNAIAVQPASHPGTVAGFVS